MRNLIVCATFLFLTPLAFAGGNPNVHKQLEKDWRKLVPESNIASLTLWPEYVRGTKISDNAFFLSTFTDSKVVSPSMSVYFKYQDIDPSSVICLEFDYLWAVPSTSDLRIQIYEETKRPGDEYNHWNPLLTCSLKYKRPKDKYLYWKHFKEKVKASKTTTAINMNLRLRTYDAVLGPKEEPVGEIWIDNFSLRVINAYTP